MLFPLIFAYDSCLTLIIFTNQAQATDFDDLGTMLLGGFALAIAVAVLAVFVKIRFQARNPQKADFLSINTDSEQK